MTSSDPELTSKQRAVVKELPGTSREIADALGTSTSAVRHRINRLNKAFDSGENHPVARDEEDVYFSQVPVENLLNDGVDEDGPDDLVGREPHILTLLPETADGIAEELGESKTVAEAYLTGIQEKGHPIACDDEGVWFIEEEDAKRRLSTQHKGTITRKVNDFRTQLEAILIRRRKNNETLVAPQDPTPGNQDFVLAVGDIHFGDDVERSTGEPAFDPYLAAASLQHLTDQGLGYKRHLEELGVSFDSAHLFWLGDMCTGMGVYSGQEFNVRMFLADQFTYASEMLTQQAARLAEAFDTLTITGVPGNHGTERSNAQSKQANLDLQLYRAVADRLSDRGYDNIDYDIGEAKHYRSRQIRGSEWNILARHGQDEQIHVDATARSEADQRGLHEYHNFDLQLRGHWHTYREETVLNQYSVITLPSAKPGDEFAERIGRPDVSTHRKLGVVFTASDKRVKEWQRVIDDIDLDPEAVDVPTIDDLRRRYTP